MPVFISDELLISGAEFGAFVPDANCPIIGISSQCTASNIFAAANTDPSYPAWLTATPATNERWKTTMATSHTWSFQPDGVSEIDYIGIAAHSGLVGRQISVTAAVPGVGGVIVFGPQLITTGDVIFVRFPAVVAATFYITFASPEAFQFSIGVINVGKLVALPRKIYVGHTPIVYGRQTTKQVGISDSGAYLGQRVTRVSQSSSVTMDNVPPDYYRNTLYNGFHRPSERLPFFWAWRPVSHPTEVGFCWLDSDLSVSNSRSNGFMSINFSMTGFVNNG